MMCKHPCVCTHDRVEYVNSSVHSTLKYVVSFELDLVSQSRVYNLSLYTQSNRGVGL